VIVARLSAAQNACDATGQSETATTNRRLSAQDCSENWPQKGARTGHLKQDSSRPRKPLEVPPQLSFCHMPMPWHVTGAAAFQQRCAGCGTPDGRGERRCAITSGVAARIAT
jgi:hypothetical protein